MRHLEELAANAWPGLHTALVDGWVVRFAEGFSRRANSVLPLQAGRSPLEERIGRCEALFRGRGMDPVFKLYPEAEPGGLDGELERRGYTKQACTSVMVLESLDRLCPDLPGDLELTLTEELTDPWFGVYGADHVGANLPVARAIMEHIVPERRFVLLSRDGVPAACALAVMEDGWAGIFDVVVRKDLRGHGLGRLVMERTLAVSGELGARRSYLQVMDENRTAVNLYRSMGYRAAYPYWYRVKEARP